MEYERLGKRLRLARERARVSQTEAARILDVTPAALSQYESGKRRIDALIVERLARLYGVSLRWIFELDEAEPEWEEALRLRADGLSTEGKRGIARLVALVSNLQELYDRTDTPVPGMPHPPFQALHDDYIPEQDVAEWAAAVRRHFGIGLVPIQDLRGFLEAQGYKVFTVSLGAEHNDLSGLFFKHPKLGPIVAVNEDRAYTRRPFTMAHEFAHGLFHHDRPAVLCRHQDQVPIERFADQFAAHFLIPQEALHEWFREMGVLKVERPEEVVHLARYFGVSYGAMFMRLAREKRVDPMSDALKSDVRPVALAKRLGYAPSDYEFGNRALPPEERLPRVYLELAFRAVREDRLSIRRVAELLGIVDYELEKQLEELANSPEKVEDPEESYARISA